MNDEQTPPKSEVKPLRDSLLAHVEKHRLLAPKGGKEAATPKIGESPVMS